MVSDRIAKAGRFTQTYFTGRTPGGQTNSPLAVPLSKALAQSDNGPKPPLFVFPFLQGHRHRDLLRALPFPAHAPRFVPVSDVWLQVFSLHGRLRAVYRANLDISLRLLLSKR